MSEKKNELIIQGETQLDDLRIYENIANIIETRKTTAGAYANREVTLMYWEVGHYINSYVLNDGRAGYGKINSEIWKKFYGAEFISNDAFCRAFFK